MTRLAVIDHGAGNLVSMEQALRRVGAEPVRITEATDFSGYDGIVLPGVGATAPAMRTLHRTGLATALQAWDGPLLGVCVGMQLLFDLSDEDGARCLGLISGTVRKIDATPLPHMGWNDVHHDGRAVLDGIPDGEPFYFVHSFAPEPADPSVVVGRTTYGDDSFATVVTDGRVTGAQFHPERSGDAGLAVLATFAHLCRRMSDAA